MALSKKRIIILWATVALIIILLGLDFVKESPFGNRMFYYTTLYGFRITPKSTNPLSLVYIGNYKYRLIYKYQLMLATVLIGFVLFMMVRENK